MYHSMTEMLTDSFSHAMQEKEPSLLICPELDTELNQLITD